MKKIIIITGPSGAGKTFALHNLEDLGYTCLDGMPSQFLLRLHDYIDPNDKKVAITLDIRNLPNNKHDINILLKGIQKKVEIQIIYIDAKQSEIIHRFSQTRRLHPLSQYNHSLSQALEIEELLLEQLKHMASLIIDTTTLSIHDLNERIKIYIQGSSESKLLLIIQSFGFKHGHPEDADYIFDVRFLPNPYWEEDLRQFNGKDQPIIDYFDRFKLVQQTIEEIENLFKIWLPLLEKNSRSYVTIAIGCTGGKHRSVYFAEKLAALFTNQYQVKLDHKCLIQK